MRGLRQTDATSMNDSGAPPSGAAAMTGEEADRASRTAALTLGLTLPGDVVLYLLLPLHAATYGVTLPEVGVLLAANRLVRIAGYGWVARFYAQQGPRTACLVAALTAAASTFGYALCSGVWALLVMRLVWGLSFAALNIANQALPTAVADGASRRAGRTRAIVAAGPMIALMAGAILSELYGPRVVFLLLGAVALLGPLTALALPRLRDGTHAAGTRFGWPEPISVWSFSLGFTLDGLFMFGLSLLAANSVPQGAVVAAGTAMALRYLMEMLLSPVGGALAQRTGARPLLIALSLLCSIGLALLGAGGIVLWIGVIATVVLRALIQPLPGPVVAEAFPGIARVPALARQATWRDIGAGVGPLVAGLLFPVVPVATIYMAGAALLAAASLLLMKKDVS
jgi:MFS family permease